MHAVKHDLDFELISPKDQKVAEVVKARNIWIKILTTRLETGEPYILYIDNVKKLLPQSYKGLGLDVDIYVKKKSQNDLYLHLFLSKDLSCALCQQQKFLLQLRGI